MICKHCGEDCPNPIYCIYCGILRNKPVPIKQPEPEPKQEPTLEETLARARARATLDEFTKIVLFKDCEKKRFMLHRPECVRLRKRHEDDKRFIEFKDIGTLALYISALKDNTFSLNYCSTCRPQRRSF